MILPASYANGFAPRDGRPLYPELWRGCVGAWVPCLGPTGLILRDWSGFGRHGTLTNMDAAGDWVASQGRYALDFDGSNDYVDIPAINLANITISAWVKSPPSGSLNESYVINRNFNGSNVPYLLNIGTQAATTGFAFFDGVWRKTGITTVVAQTNKWTHVAGSYDGATLKYFVNGKLDASLTYAGTLPTSTQTINIGRYLNNVSYMLGQLDDVRLYSVALSENTLSILATRRGLAYELAPRRRSRVSVLASLRYNIFTGNVGSLEVIGAS